MMTAVNTEEWFDKHTDELVEDICMLVRIPSVSVKTEDPEMPYGPECRRVLDACLKLGESMGFTPFNHENYCGTLLWKRKSASSAMRMWFRPERAGRISRMSQPLRTA